MYINKIGYMLSYETIMRMTTMKLLIEYPIKDIFSNYAYNADIDHMSDNEKRGTYEALMFLVLHRIHYVDCDIRQNRLYELTRLDMDSANRAIEKYAVGYPFKELALTLRNIETITDIKLTNYQTFEVHYE